MRRYAAGLPHIGAPSTRTAPLLGRSWPVTSLRNVDLPAPFGPSRPLMPGGSETVTSLRPMTWPYHFDTASATTTGGVT